MFLTAKGFNIRREQINKKRSLIYLQAIARLVNLAFLKVKIVNDQLIGTMFDFLELSETSNSPSLLVSTFGVNLYLRLKCLFDDWITKIYCRLAGWSDENYIPHARAIHNLLGTPNLKLKSFRIQYRGGSPSYRGRTYFIKFFFWTTIIVITSEIYYQQHPSSNPIQYSLLLKRARLKLRRALRDNNFLFNKNNWIYP